MKKQKESNPFTNQFVIEASEIRYKRIYNMGASITEKNKPVSVWMNSGTLKAIVEFSPSAKDMIFYILNHLGYNRETIELEFSNYKLKTGQDISLRTFQRAIAELSNKVIQNKSTRKNVYYINPAFLFKGSRIKAYPNNISITYVDPTITLLRENGIIPEREAIRSELSPDDDE